MKKLFLSLAALLFVAVSANAQEAEQWWIGGSVGVTSISPNVGDSETSFIIKPEVGYQINDRWGVGMSIGFSQEPSGTDKFNTFIINPFVRYSFLKGGIGNLFVEGGVEYTHGQLKDGNFKSNEIGIAFRPGVNVNISDNLSLIGKFGVLGFNRETESKENTFNFSVNPANDLQLGLIFKF